MAVWHIDFRIRILREANILPKTPITSMAAANQQISRDS